VAAGLIVEHLDAVEHIGAGNVTGFTDAFLDLLLFQTDEEGLRSRLITAVAAPAYTGLLVVFRTESRSSMTAVLVPDLFLWPHATSGADAKRPPISLLDHCFFELGFIKQPRIIL